MRKLCLYLTMVACVAACQSTDRRPPQFTYSPDQPQEIVVLFDSGVSQSDVNRFNLDRLHRYREGRGYEQRFPIQMVALARAADGRPLLVIRLQPNATTPERNSLDSLFAASPIVKRVLRDTAPSAVGLPRKSK